MKLRAYSFESIETAQLRQRADRRAFRLFWVLLLAFLALAAWLILVEVPRVPLDDLFR